MKQSASYAIKAWIENHKEELIRTYHELHSIAEISWQEHRTTAYLREKLDAIGVSCTAIESGTGLLAVWEGMQKGPVVALRSDIDALWQFVNQEWKANHSCGHDAHMTMALYALYCLKDIGYHPIGTLKALFQPAEETGEGARKMLELGLLDDVNCLVGIHVRPRIELAYGTASAAIYHGAAATIHGTITGKQAHASRPNEGINVMDSLAAIITAINAIKLDPTVPASCKMTKANIPNQSANIIPGNAEFTLDLRAQSNEALDHLLAEVERAVPAAGGVNRARVDIRLGHRTAAATPNAGMERVVGEAIMDILGEAGLAKPPITPGGEDFHVYPLLKPSLQATMIGLGTDLVPGLHHPQMHFNLEALGHGAAIMALSAIKLFENQMGKDSQLEGEKI